MYMYYSGTPLLRTPLEPLRSVLYKEVSLIQGLINLIPMWSIRDSAQCPLYAVPVSLFQSVHIEGVHCTYENNSS